jgi:hypothetical protein
MGGENYFAKYKIQRNTGIMISAKNTGPALPGLLLPLSSWLFM